MGSPLHASSPAIKTNHRKNQRRWKLKVLSLNCNSIKSVNKQAEFPALLDLHKPDVLGCESKIDPSIPTYSVFSDRYEVFRKDRSCHGGGVFIAINNSITSFCEPQLDIQDCEIITASIQCTRTKKLYISSFPSSSDVSLLDLLDDFLSRLYRRSRCPQLILGGDFNCGGINWTTLDLHPGVPTHMCDRALLSIVDKYGLSQHVKWPTRNNRTLDLSFSSRPETIQACHVTSGMSDHETVLFEVDVSPKYTPKRPHKIYQFHKGDFPSLRSSLSDFASAYLASNPELLIPGPDQASAQGSVKRAWSYLKLLWTDSIGIPTLFADNRVCNSDHAKAKALGDHYENVFT